MELQTIVEKQAHIHIPTFQHSLKVDQCFILR